MSGDTSASHKILCRGHVASAGLIVEYVGQNAGLCFSVFGVAGLTDRLLRRHCGRPQRPSCDNRVTHAAVDPEHRHAVQHYADQPCGADKP